MARTKTSKGRVIQEYILKYSEQIKSGAMKKRALSRMILKDNPHLWDNEESIRSTIKGQTNGWKNKKPTIMAKQKNRGSQFPIPKSEAKALEPYVINKEGKYLVFSDVHLPYHDEEALKVMYSAKKKYAGVIINGDLTDNYKASRWLKDGSKPDLHYEYEMTRQFLRDLKTFYKCPIYYKFGNHDERLALYMYQQIPELARYVSEFIGTIFNFEELGVEYIKSSQLIHLGKLIILHGHEFGRSVFSPVNPARGLFMRAKASSLMGHHHQTSEHAEGNLKKDRIVTYSLGCLCNLEPEYAPLAYTKWNHGFAEVDLFKDGSYTVHNYKIVEGKIR